MSTNGGSVWTNIESYYTDGGDFVADPQNNTTFYSCGRYYNSPNYVMTASKTTNSGSSWTRYFLSSAAGMAFSIAVDPLNSSIVYVGGIPSLYKTTNAGTSWFDATNGITDTIFDIAIDPVNTNTIYAATPDGVFKTTNAGSNWTNIGCAGARAVLIDPDNHTQIYSGTSSGVYKSTSSGGSWTSMNDGLNGSHVTSLGINPGTYIFAGTEDAAMFRWSIQVGVAEQTNTDLSTLRLSIHPNPVRTEATILYTLGNQTRVHIALYDVQGRFVCLLVNAFQSPGSYSEHWDGSDAHGTPMANGMYICHMTTDTDVKMQTLILCR
ncbi:T9SS type A sorting domain-containing protein [candidate division WOR-3 bacterium]|nr:T9SS type A sorting domain-containing protein [candidate division WOR-3 bacterium]